MRAHARTNTHTQKIYSTKLSHFRSSILKKTKQNKNGALQYPQDPQQWSLRSLLKHCLTVTSIYFNKAQEATAALAHKC